jgi:hypothetical protein
MQFRRNIRRNPEVIALLETYLAIAKEHKMGHVAISLCNYRGEGAPADFGCCDYAGDIALEKSQQETVGMLYNKLGGSIANWELPPANEELDASHVRYNIAAGPLSFDFMTWLIDAEMTRVREGAPPPLRVAFWTGKEEKVTPERSMWLNNVFRPMLGFIGAVEDNTAIGGRHKELYVPRDIVAAYNAGERLPKITPPRIIETPQAPVTITLREAEHWEFRNSNLDAWCKFARLLMDRGEHVIFIRDTAKATEPLPGFMTYPLASVDLGERFSLYEAAKANLFVSNGPGGFAIFASRRPFLMFTPIEDEGCDFIANTPWFWKHKNGVEMGDQYPWFAEDQRIIWELDTYESILNAWNTYIEPGLSGNETELAMRLVS